MRVSGARPCAPTWHQVEWRDRHHGGRRVLYVAGAPSTQDAARAALLHAFGAERPAMAPENVIVEERAPTRVRPFCRRVGEPDRLAVDEWLSAQIYFRREGVSDPYLQASRSFESARSALRYLGQAPAEAGGETDRVRAARDHLIAAFEELAALVGELEAKGNRR